MSHRQTTSNAAVISDVIGDFAHSTIPVPFASLAAVGGQPEGDIGLQGSARFDAYINSVIAMQGQHSLNAPDSDFPSGTSGTLFDGGSVSSNRTCLTNGHPFPWPGDIPILQDTVPKRPTDEEDTEIITPLRDKTEGLPILIHNVPSTGIKTRVESSVKMALDLVKLRSDMSAYDRVGSWKWLRLPEGTTCKPMDSAQMISASSDETLRLSVVVQCHSNPRVPVRICTLCRNRESAAAERKSAETGTAPTGNGKERLQESSRDPERIVVFVGQALRAFDGGRVYLRARVTCYCKHHQEDVGFRLTYTMADSQGRVIGRGTTPPIFVTDNHKTARKPAAPERRVKKGRNSRNGTQAHAPTLQVGGPCDVVGLPSTSHEHRSTSAYTSPSVPRSSASRFSFDLPTPIATNDTDATIPFLIDDSQLATAPSGAVHQAPDARTVDFDVPASQAPPCVVAIAPSSGPTSGGTCVHVVGMNFLPTHQILFDSTPAMTFPWSDTVIRCISPPSTHAENVLVSILGVPVMTGGGVSKGIPPLFKYEDIQENEMMRMALWLVGRKLTGTDQTASSVANLILSHPQFRPSVAPGEGFGDGELLSLFAAGDLEHMVIGLTKLVVFDPHESAIHAGETLSLARIDGKTLIHLSASLGFHQLTAELIAHGVDLNKRDVNGFTALHYTALHNQASCARLLIDGGADGNIVDAWGRVAREVALYFHHDDVCAEFEAGESTPSASDSTSTGHHDDGATERKDFDFGTGETATNVSPNVLHSETPTEAPLSRMTKGDGGVTSHASPRLTSELLEGAECSNETPPRVHKPGSRGLTAEDPNLSPDTRPLRASLHRVHQSPHHPPPGGPPCAAPPGSSPFPGGPPQGASYTAPRGHISPPGPLLWSDFAAPPPGDFNKAMGAGGKRRSDSIYAYAAERNWTLQWEDANYSSRGRVIWTTKLFLDGVMVSNSQSPSLAKARQNAATKYLSRIGVILDSCDPTD